MCVILEGMSDLGSRIRQAREAAGLTQGEVAESVGVTTGGVSAWEVGHAKTIRGDLLFKLADKLGVSPRWLATGDDTLTVPPTAYTELLRTLESLPAEQQQAIFSLAASLLAAQRKR